MRVYIAPFVPCKTFFIVSFCSDFRPDGCKGKNDKLGKNKKVKIGNRKATVTTITAVTNASVSDLQVQKTWPSFRVVRGAGRPRFRPLLSLLPSLFHPPIIRIPGLKAPCVLSVSFFLFLCQLLPSYYLQTLMQQCRLCGGWTSSGWHFESRKDTIAFCWPRRARIK